MCSSLGLLEEEIWDDPCQIGQPILQQDAVRREVPSETTAGHDQGAVQYLKRLLTIASWLLNVAFWEQFLSHSWVLNDKFGRESLYTAQLASFLPSLLTLQRLLLRGRYWSSKQSRRPDAPVFIIVYSVCML